MSLDRFRLFPSPPDVTGRSVFFPELELDYVSRHAMPAATHWMRGMLGFVVFEVVGWLCLGLCWGVPECLGRVSLTVKVILAAGEPSSLLLSPFTDFFFL